MLHLGLGHCTVTHQCKTFSHFSTTKNIFLFIYQHTLQILFQKWALPSLKGCNLQGRISDGFVLNFLSSLHISEAEGDQALYFLSGPTPSPVTVMSLTSAVCKSLFPVGLCILNQ